MKAFKCEMGNTFKSYFSMKKNYKIIEAPLKMFDAYCHFKNIIFSVGIYDKNTIKIRFLIFIELISTIVDRVDIFVHLKKKS